MTIKECFSSSHEVSDTKILDTLPKVSVAMITYNHEAYLSEAIEGIIQQITNFPFELIIGEDCSKDNTRNIALEYQKRYPHIIRVIYSDSNVGAMANVKRVFAACRGEFVATCEGDDYWNDINKLQLQHDILTQFNNIDICIHSCYSKSTQSSQEELAGVRSSSDCILSLSEMITDELVYVPTASNFIRRNILIQINEWLSENKPPCGDYFIQVLAANRGGAYYLNKPMSVYRTNVPGSWTHTLHANFDILLEMDFQFFNAIKKMEPLIAGQEESFKHKYIFYYSRFLHYSYNRLYQMERMIVPLVKHLYSGNETTDKSSILSKYLSQYATDCAFASITLEKRTNRSIIWQFLRVSKSIFVYLLSSLILYKIYCSQSTDYMKSIAKWKQEGQGKFLIYRWNYFIESLKNTIKLH
jgi:glycosyltransferase involved in cell wall biosynthesis